MSGGWNSDPPPTAAFLEKLEAFVAAPGANEVARLDRYRELIEAISTKEDLAEFLLQMSGRLRSEPIENHTIEQYWEALSGVVLVDGGRDPNPWRGLARMLDKALYYE